MALLSQNTETIGGEKLLNWEFIASGGFGSVYKARHRDWGFDVAVKVIHNTAGRLSQASLVAPPEDSLRDEARYMDRASCEFVLKVYGIYQDVAPNRGERVQQGLVMELVDGGSIQTLQGKLPGPPPKPLAFRLAHEVALGMNFLHLRNVLHHDLKPSNVLLTENLNAKLADFGLSRISTSALSGNGSPAGMIGGSFKYMPPEAFKTSYEPVRAFDRYSYGILLWSIFSGKEPYPDVDYNLVALRIPRGDRPCCDEIDREELGEMFYLMKKCWDGNPNARPTFKECLEITEKLFSKHKKGVLDAVHHILKQLASPTNDPQSSIRIAASFPSSKPDSPQKSIDIVDHPHSPSQDSVSAPTLAVTAVDKAKFVDDNWSDLIQRVSKVMGIAEQLGDMVHKEALAGIEAKETNQDRMRELYRRALHSGGTVVKAAFYDALRTHHPNLVDSLGD